MSLIEDFVVVVILGGLLGAVIGLLLERKADEYIRNRFREKNANSPDKAVTFQQLELEDWVKARFRRLVKQGKIKQTLDGRYYIDFIEW